MQRVLKTISRQTSASDSVKMASSGEPSFFEGTEKLLEVWFSSNKGEGSKNLRMIKRYSFKLLSILSGCAQITILSLVFVSLRYN